MLRRIALAVVAIYLGGVVGGAAEAQEGLPKIPRLLPPPGIELPAQVRERLAKEAAAVREAFAGVAGHAHAADAEIFVKAVEFALEFNEFYTEKDVAKADDQLQLARERIVALAKNETSWLRQTGLVVRGYRSQIDGSPQPYGLVIPAGHDFAKPCPLYVFLHGRGEKTTDLHFIAERLNNPGQIAPQGAIVLHPFGRQCLGWKSAGEIDCLEAVASVGRNAAIDERRIALMGFSMGGAGAWHLGAHYTHRWCAVAPGAGFAETARFINLKFEEPQTLPPWYEQKLWGAYDVPCYVRNLFNVPVVAYSGEKDKQIQAARVMEEAFQAEGQTLRHIIGPNTEHKYHPESLAQIMAALQEAVAQGQNTAPDKISLQTRTLRYSRLHWVSLLGLEEHWREARVDAALDAAGQLSAKTVNATAVEFAFPKPDRIGQVELDGQKFATRGRTPVVFQKQAGQWHLLENEQAFMLRGKRPGLQGPIDDAFLAPFIVVKPDGKSPHPAVQRWVEAELAHFEERWRGVLRGALVVKWPSQVTASDRTTKNLVLWGDPSSNSLIAQLAPKLPLVWNAQQLEMGNSQFAVATHVPVLIYPNPLGGGFTGHQPPYVVLNSGPTFREAHDRSNSLQNPHLPDWAIVDVSVPPSDSAPGRIAAADFFDEAWQYKVSRPQE